MHTVVYCTHMQAVPSARPPSFTGRALLKMDKQNCLGQVDSTHAKVKSFGSASRAAQLRRSGLEAIQYMRAVHHVSKRLHALIAMGWVGSGSAVLALLMRRSRLVCRLKTLQNPVS